MSNSPGKYYEAVNFENCFIYVSYKLDLAGTIYLLSYYNLTKYKEHSVCTFVFFSNHHQQWWSFLKQTNKQTN